jgi:hypothetical protein
MTLAIVLVCVMLYLGLAIAVGRFCGINSAWERIVQETMGEQRRSGPSPEEILAEKLDEAERILEETASESKEEETATQPV